MTQIIKDGGKTIIKTGERIDTMNAPQFEQDIQPALVDGGVDLEMDCTDLNYMASSGLRIIQKTMRTVMQVVRTIDYTCCGRRTGYCIVFPDEGHSQTGC